MGGEPGGDGGGPVDGGSGADGGVCGILLADRAEVDLSRGVITGHPIGACVQVPGFDVARLSTDVRHTDNGVNLDATELPVPPASETLGG